MCIDLFGGPPNNLKNNSNKLFKKNKRDSEQTITAKNIFERFSDLPKLSLCFNYLFSTLNECFLPLIRVLLPVSQGKYHCQWLPCLVWVRCLGLNKQKNVGTPPPPPPSPMLVIPFISLLEEKTVLTRFESCCLCPMDPMPCVSLVP